MSKAPVGTVLSVFRTTLCTCKQIKYLVLKHGIFGLRLYPFSSAYEFQIGFLKSIAIMHLSTEDSQNSQYLAVSRYSTMFLYTDVALGLLPEAKNS